MKQPNYARPEAVALNVIGGQIHRVMDECFPEPCTGFANTVRARLQAIAEYVRRIELGVRKSADPADLVRALERIAQHQTRPSVRRIARAALEKWREE